MQGISVLGPLLVVQADGSRSLRSRHQRLLLAILASRRGRPIEADVLVDALWGDDLPNHPTAALQSQVFRLRKLLEAVGCTLAAEATGYRFECPASLLDAARFEALVTDADTARTSEPAVALALLDEAIGLWRGRAFGETADHDAIRGAAAHLDDLRVEATERRASVLLRLGRVAEAADAAEGLIAEHPFREGPVALRMRALAADGRHVDALDTYQRFRSLLCDELGLEPSPELRSVESDILRHERPGMPAIGLPGNSLVGRATDLDRIVAALGHGRLVTLTGPGGVGKSRLGVHAADVVGDDYPDGVWLCELAAVDRSEAVASAIAATLEIQPLADEVPEARIVRFLQARRSLLVIDNCEHVLAGASALVATVLARTAHVQIIATTRTRLGIDGERVEAVAPLVAPAPGQTDSPAVTLFVDRARAVSNDFELTDGGADAVVEMCRAVDGLPLAIELLAARTIARSPEEICADVVDHLERISDPRRATERHRSMDAVVSWSFDRLEQRERDVFVIASVFARGFTAEAVGAVAGVDEIDVVEALTALVDQSLVQVTRDGGTTRFSMLEPVRQFAEARLDADRRAGFDAGLTSWFEQFLERADAGLRSSDELRWSRSVAAELANIRASVHWAMDHDPDVAARITGRLYWYVTWYSAPEVFEWAEALAARSDSLDHQAWCALAPTAALGAFRSGDVETARRHAASGVEYTERIGVVPSARFVWEARGNLEGVSGNWEPALDIWRRTVELCFAADDIAMAARNLASCGLVHAYNGRLAEAEADLVRAHEAADRAGCATAKGMCDYASGEAASERSEALAYLGRAATAARRLGNRYLGAVAGLTLVSSAARSGDPAAALPGFANVLDYFERSGSRAQQWTVVRSLIETLAATRRDEAACILAGALDATATGLPIIGDDATRLSAAAAELRERLGTQRFDELWARGAALGDDDALAFARRELRPTPGEA